MKMSGIAPSVASLVLLLQAAPDIVAQQVDPPRCSGYGEVVSWDLTDWEVGLDAWSAGTRDVTSPATFDTPDWTVLGDLPDGRPGNAAFVENLDSGDCETDDESGVLFLESPAIDIPDGVNVPRISLDHWMASEFLFDGGNLKLSVNGGPFQLLSAEALEVGRYNALLAGTDAFNTNPLAGEPAFTGIDGAPMLGSWGETRVNLFGLAQAGDSIRLRVEFGVDGCNGEIGWFVDDVDFYYCSLEPVPSDCGNGLLDVGEACDDGNDFFGDGCSSACQVENGWSCTLPEPPGTIADPSFEGGTPNPEWDEYSLNFGTPICGDNCPLSGGSGPLDGDYWVWFGGTLGREESSVSQSVVIPASVSRLEFGLEVGSCASPSDYLRVTIDESEVWRVTGGSNLCGQFGYTMQSVDVTPFADGARHDLRFHSEVFGPEVTSFFLDVVELPGTPSVCTPSAATRLTLVKQVVNDDGGSAAPSDWTLSATGPTGFSGVGPTVASGEGFEPGSYDLAESGGPAGYLAGDWSCTGGGSQVDGDTVSIAAGESVTCTIVNDDIAPPPPTSINAGHSGAWFYPDTAGQGIFVDIDESQRFMFISWFTYTAEGSDHPYEQHWYTAQGNYADDSALLTLNETLGGRFDDPQAVTTLPVGEVTISFQDCENGRMAYNFDGGAAGEFPLVRVIPGSGAVCAGRAQNALREQDINPGMDGSWYDLQTPGQGFFLDANTGQTPEDNFLFLSWFTYGDATASGLRWLTAQGTFQGSSATIEISETTGGSFDDPRPPSTVPAGSLTIDFSDCDNAQLNYALTNDGLEGEITLTRVIPSAGALCEELAN